MQAHKKRDNAIAIIVAAIIYCTAFFVFTFAFAPNGDQPVYITNTGECYHQSGCSSLGHINFSQSLKDAIQSGYRRCNNCDPPELIDGNRNLRVPWWAYFIFSPIIAFCVWSISAFILALLSFLIHFDFNSIVFEYTFPAYILFAIFFLAALDVFL